MKVHQTVTNLMRQRIDAPPSVADPIAERKGHDTAGGLAMFLFGMALALFGLGLLTLPLLLLREQPSLWLIAFATLLVLAGMYCIGVGGHRMSGEAMEEAAKGGAGFFTVLAKLFRLTKWAKP